MRPSIAAALISVSATLAASAQHAGDVLLTLDGAGRISTNAFISAAATPNRVFISRLGVDFPDFTADPGFDCFPGTFPAPSRNGFRVLKALRAWDGSSFATIPAERLEIAFGTFTPILTPLTDTVVDGFTLTVASNGQWHRHLEYTLLAPASDGIYLLELSLFSNHPEVRESDPFWILFDQNADGEALSAAAAWVLNQANPCSADFNSDGFVDFFDFDDFVAVFETGDPSSDFNRDGFTDFFDFDDFVAAFETGC
jgi:hypothetical protein